MITCSMPAATASSTAYWMTGLSTSGSISFGCAFVAGRNRVPHPAAGNTAFRTRIEPHVRGRAGAWLARGEDSTGLPPGPDAGSAEDGTVATPEPGECHGPHR